ncbi:MAG: hypothetical protein ACK4KU_14435 [Acinetobacter sp.]|uniref:hypothetical protein n=1 Tax=Acinetobacter sp. TaxID=472 RepID=UPI0039187DF8
MFFGYPVEIWLASLVAVIIRLQTADRLTVLGAAATILVALLAGILLYGPIIVLLGLSQTWAVPMAIIVALSAENIMKIIVEMSADKDWLKGWIKHLVSKDNNKKDD